MSREFNYELNARLFKILSKKEGRLICNRCKEPLKIGDKIVSRLSSNPHGKNKVKRYHQVCWLSLFID